MIETLKRKLPDLTGVAKLWLETREALMGNPHLTTAHHALSDINYFLKMPEKGSSRTVIILHGSKETESGYVIPTGLSLDPTDHSDRAIAKRHKDYIERIIQERHTSPGNLARLEIYLDNLRSEIKSG